MNGTSYEDRLFFLVLFSSLENTFLFFLLSSFIFDLAVLRDL